MIIIVIIVIHLVILNYVNKMLLDYIIINRKNCTYLVKYFDFLMLFFHQRTAKISAPQATLTCPAVHILCMAIMGG